MIPVEIARTYALGYLSAISIFGIFAILSKIIDLKRGGTI